MPGAVCRSARDAREGEAGMTGVHRIWCVHRILMALVARRLKEGYTQVGPAGVNCGLTDYAWTFISASILNVITSSRVNRSLFGQLCLAGHEPTRSSGTHSTFRRGARPQSFRNCTRTRGFSLSAKSPQLLRPWSIESPAWSVQAWSPSACCVQCEQSEVNESAISPVRSRSVRLLAALREIADRVCSREYRRACADAVRPCRRRNRPSGSWRPFAMSSTVVSLARHCGVRARTHTDTRELFSKHCGSHVILGYPLLCAHQSRCARSPHPQW
jgi:hypothetical protein